MQCFKRCVLLFASLIILAGVCAVAGRSVLAQWLSRGDAAAPAAAIVILGGDPSRALEAADLYRAGYSARIFVTAPLRERRLARLDEAGVATPREEDLTLRVLAARGVPRAAVEFLGHDIASTYQEATLVRERLGSLAGAVLVVTSPYHVRRAGLIFASELPQGRLRVIGSRYERLPAQWWRDPEAARNITLETVKLLYYLLGGRFSSASASGT